MQSGALPDRGKLQRGRGKYLRLILLLPMLAACAPANLAPTTTSIPQALPSSTLPAEPNASQLQTTAPALTFTPQATLIPYDTPDWFKDEIVYEIFVRSYADSDGNGIGDFKGITQKLDTIQALGATTIWLMPIYPSPSDHGYDVMDYYAVNPDYGTMEDLQELVVAVHDRGMKIILDFVPSHLSNQNPLFEEAYSNPESEYSDWFVWTNEAQTTYAGFADNEALPRFNHYNPEVVAYLSDAARFWLDLDGDEDTTDGIDGFRVDNVTFPPQEFLVALRQAVKSANPEAIFLGEAWVHTASDLSHFFPDQFDALFDFPLYELMQGDPDSNGDGLLAGKSFPVLLTALLEEENHRFLSEAIPLRFFSNHDTNRISTELSGDPARTRLAVVLLASLPGPALIYYGEEIGMPGQKGGPPGWDNYRREPMDWYAAESGPGQTTWFMPEDSWNQPEDGVSVEEQENDPHSLLNYYRAVFNARNASLALSRGDFMVLDLDVSAPGGWGFVRSGDGEQVVGLLNFSRDPVEVIVKGFPFSAESLTDLLAWTTYPAANEGKPYTIQLPPSSAVWLVRSVP